jgi:hypothetical protein
MHMSFRPDSPLNRLVLLWPGVPIAACALGFSLALYQVAQTRSGSFAALAIAMGFGLVLSLGLLFHCFFIAWTEVIVTSEGLGLRPVGMGWFNARPRVLPWGRLDAAREVVTRQGGHLEIAVAGETYRLERALFREETYADLCRIVAEAASRRRRVGYDKGLAAA